VWRTDHPPSSKTERGYSPIPSVSAAKTSFYKRSNFVTHLPTEFLYSPSHFWLANVGGPRWRVGFTKFATRMLGDVVDVQFQKAVGDAVSSGEIIGSIEGFKAISDIYCVGDGQFSALNPVLRDNAAIIADAPYADGWLYEIAGQPDRRTKSRGTDRRI